MKHLKLFEKFKSKTISSIIDFISKKYNKESANIFLKDIRLLLNNYKLPISEINDEDINYISSKEAKLIKTPKDYDIMNPWGIYSIKFWFSLESGYLGYTAAGEDKSNLFDEKEIEKIKELGYTKGTLEFIRNFKKLETGDKIIGYFNSSLDMDYFSDATIYIQNENYYAIQDVSNGGVPNSWDWQKFGRFSWIIDEEGDNNKLHIWKPGDNKLEIINEKLEGENYIDKLSGNLFLKKPSNPSISDLIKIEDSDFAIVIFLDHLIKYEDVEDIRWFRKETKSGATSLLTDDEIKKLNYEKYITKIISGSGISIDTKIEDIKDLQKIILRFLVGRFVLITVYKKSPDFISHTNYFLKRLKELIKSDNDKKEKLLNSVLESYKSCIYDSEEYRIKFIGSTKKVEELGNEKTKEMVNEVYNLSKYLEEKIKSNKIDTIEDCTIILYKLKSLHDFMNDNSVKFKSYMGSLLDNFNYDDVDVTKSIKGLNTSSYDDIKDDFEKSLNIIKRFIDITF
jgi:hypothetical protein